MIAEHQEKYDVHFGLPDLSELPDGTVVGITAYTHEPSKQRWIEPKAQVLPKVTASDLARLFLQSAYDLPIRRRKDQLNPSQLPLFVRKGTYPDCVYIDIKSTYRSIVEAFGFDVEYRLGSYLSCDTGIRLPDDLRKCKAAYASVVSLSANYKSVMQVKRGARLETVYVRNVYHQPCLWSLTRDLLHAVYTAMFYNVRLFYANTDGYIVRRKDLELSESIIASFGFTSSIKATGNAVVYGVGSYRIGKVATKRVSHSENFGTKPMPRHYVSWLRQRTLPLLSKVSQSADR
ncbi:MAG: hypothetical protein D6823_12560 [Chloroflexi bacterium]|nr:MAG: hypothetical protein D6823_12560 [Chloroflexota bacterium]